MPYIKPEFRSDLDQVIEDLNPSDVGHLNYVITKLCLQFMIKRTKCNYEAYNSVIGVLECAKLEMYRRAVAPYEDENGDVYK